MKWTRLNVVCFFIWVAFNFNVWAEVEMKQDLPELIENEICFLFIDEPIGYMLEARENFIKGELADAALDIRKAAAFMKLEAYYSEKQEKKIMMIVVKEMEKLAKNVESGKVINGKKLEEVFATAEFIFAWHYALKAERYEIDGNFEKMSYAIHASVNHLLSASFWNSEGLDGQDIHEIKESRTMTKNAIDNASQDLKKLKKPLKTIKNGLKSLSKRVKPPTDDFQIYPAE